MGTRHLTKVISEKKTVVAQYGQWDGYPGGQGITILKFIKKTPISKFKDKLKKVKFLDDKKEKEIDDFLKSIGSDNGWMNTEQAELYHQKYPFLTRDNGADVLNMIYAYDGEEPIWLSDASSFMEDGLFCEWAYILDLDKRELSVYKSGDYLICTFKFSELKKMNDDEFVNSIKKIAYAD